MKYGGRKKGTPNNSTKELRGRITQIVDDTFNKLDLNALTNKERIELLGKLLPYITPRLNSLTLDEEKNEQFTPIEVTIIHQNNENQNNC